MHLPILHRHWLTFTACLHLFTVDVVAGAGQPSCSRQKKEESDRLLVFFVAVSLFHPSVVFLPSPLFLVHSSLSLSLFLSVVLFLPLQRCNVCSSRPSTASCVTSLPGRLSCKHKHTHASAKEHTHAHTPSHMGAANYDHIHPAETQLSQLAVWAALRERHIIRRRRNAPFTSIIQQMHTREEKKTNGVLLFSQISLGWFATKGEDFLCSSDGEEDRERGSDINAEGWKSLAALIGIRKGQTGISIRHLHKKQSKETAYARFYLNETRLFVETRSVTQLGKSIFSEYIHTPTKKKTEKEEETQINSRAMLSSLTNSSHFKYVTNLRYRLVGRILCFQVCQVMLSNAEITA